MARNRGKFLWTVWLNPGVLSLLDLQNPQTCPLTIHRRTPHRTRVLLPPCPPTCRPSPPRPGAFDTTEKYGKVGSNNGSIRRRGEESGGFEILVDNEMTMYFM